MAAKEILVVEDERPVREMIAFCLSRAGFTVREAADARSAQTAVDERVPHLVLLDWMLPGVSGIEFARVLKADPRTCELPIVIQTAEAEESDKVEGLDGGADDYLTKPFSPAELIARLKAVLRRASGHVVPEGVQMAGIRIDPSSRRIFASECCVHLGPSEYQMLEFLMRNAERAFSRTQLLIGAWGSNRYMDERTVDVRILRLRKSLKTGGYDHMVQTVRGRGYRFSTNPKA
ncbi:MAG: phosphate regulon transcriptional regulator PhoB [Steroidobacteraceae bacterium]